MNINLQGQSIRLRRTYPLIILLKGKEPVQGHVLGQHFTNEHHPREDKGFEWRSLRKFNIINLRGHGSESGIFYTLLSL